ncbi:MAG: hypothetical protein IGS03_02030 [Candidatus Sericytochromatia bacterium]|nr:hypothetical protein [Candidatus Sericytochromatia bacterium]
MHTPSLSWKRWLTRCLAFVLTLFACDLWVQVRWAALLQTDIGAQYRLPADQEVPVLNATLDQIARLPDFSTRLSTGPKVMFLGSSPTYGVSITDPAATYPAVVRQHWLNAQPPKPLAVYNLAAKGFLMADNYYLLQRSLPLGELFVIQLNYHTFSPRLLESTPIRHPELPETLGVSISHSEARLLGLRPSPLVNLNAPLRHWLRQHWFFYREKERLAALWLGASPENWLYRQFFAQASDEEAPDSQPFYTLPNARQVYMVKRYAENVDFEITSHNPELQFLERMLRLLQASGKPAVFFLAPINADALNYYEVMDWQRYASHSQLLRQKIEGAGFRFLDPNLASNGQEPLTEEHFADISHTLNSGAKLFGARLAQFLKPELERLP